MTDGSLSSTERRDLFTRCAALVRGECDCRGGDENCARCFDLLQIFRIHRTLMVGEFHGMARREGEHVGKVEPLQGGKQWKG